MFNHHSLENPRKLVFMTGRRERSGEFGLLYSSQHKASSPTSFTGTLDSRGMFRGILESPRHANECSTAISALK